MSAQVIARPSTPPRSRSALIALAALAVIVIAVSAGVAALVSDASSGGSAPAAAPAAVATADSCPGDAGTLLTLVAALPVDVNPGIERSLSPATVAMIRSAATLSAVTNSSPRTLNGSTVAGVLSRITPTDSAVILDALEPRARAAVQAANPQVCG
jgi:hypothetical protein